MTKLTHEQKRHYDARTNHSLKRAAERYGLEWDTKMLGEFKGRIYGR